MTRRPVSTYRLQITPGTDLDAALDTVGYLRDLGVSWVYLSPLLQAASGSDHGYDVVDPTTVDAARGGRQALERLAQAAHDAGLGVLADIVPNHVGVAVPHENPSWWETLRLGREAPAAAMFDIDWVAGDGRVRLPILAGTVEEARAGAAVDAAAETIRIADHVLPLAPGSLDAGETDIAALLSRQHWQVVPWREEARSLNYRRFFAVSSLAGVRVEDAAVFEATHAEILRWIRAGIVDGLRVDHPDGLRDPGAYLDRLAAATGGAFVLVEKILEHGEALPSWWATDGTTGYDALAVIDRVLIDPAGEPELDALDDVLRASTGMPARESWTAVVHDAKLEVAAGILGSEVARIVGLLPPGIPDAVDAVRELLACFPVYRSYLPAGREHLIAAARESAARRPDLAQSIAAVVETLGDPSQEAAIRFEQTTGPVMAKGVEDSAFYRVSRLGTLTEVGADPSEFAVTVAQFHAAQAARLAEWPHGMTTLSTHDTKRGEDVRARLSVLAEIPARWAEVLGALRSVASSGDGPLDALLWQAVIGAWPASDERLRAYVTKAIREAGTRTTWTEPNEAFERRALTIVDAAFGDAAPIVEAFVAEIAPHGWSNALSAKLLQLTGPGVPDVYQGSELWETSLVDPDNRRPVDIGRRRRLLAALDDPARTDPPAVDEGGTAKLLVVSRALRARRDRPDLFTRYSPLVAVGSSADHVVAADRGGAVVLATRLPAGLAATGWGDTTVLVPAGRGSGLRDLLTGRTFPSGPLPVAHILRDLPVALLVPADEEVAS